MYAPVGTKAVTVYDILRRRRCALSECDARRADDFADGDAQAGSSGHAGAQSHSDDSEQPPAVRAAVRALNGACADGEA